MDHELQRADWWLLAGFDELRVSINIEDYDEVQEALLYIRDQLMVELPIDLVHLRYIVQNKHKHSNIYLNGEIHG